MRKLFTKAVILVIIVGIAGAIYMWQRYQYMISTPVNAESVEETVFTINKGDTTGEIASELHEEELILDVDAFRWYARLNNVDKDIRTGRFALSPAMTIPEIARVITSDQQVEIIITIPEGSDVRQIDQILVDESLINPGEYIKAVQNFDGFEFYEFLEASEVADLAYPLEGYLYPDTYYVSPTDFTPGKFVFQQLDTFETRIAELVFPRGISDTINVAAMVEEEANRDKDRPIIAGIIWKRLDENWLLGIDATLLYTQDDRKITYQDLQDNTPYNTRNSMGLPPGPITNPGFASIKAAAEPESSEYYYYLTGTDGNMYYAVTDGEHNANKRRYL